MKNTDKGEGSNSISCLRHFTIWLILIYEDFAPMGAFSRKLIKGRLQNLTALRLKLERFYFSMIIVIPWPPAAQTEMNPRPDPFWFKSFAMVAMSLPPVAAKG